MLAQRLLAGLTFLLASLGWQVSFTQSVLQASGLKIVNASSQEVSLRGVSLGGWPVQESYL